MPSPGHLHFMCGKAGAGKSTMAASLARQHQATLLVEDIWLQRLFGDQMKTFDDHIRCAPRIRSVAGPLAVDLLVAGRDVVMDFQANTRPLRVWFRSLFEQAKAGHTLHFLDTPDGECLQRIGQRNVERPEGSSQLSVEDFFLVSSYFQAPGEDEGFNVRRHEAEGGG